MLDWIILRVIKAYTVVIDVLMAYKHAKMTHTNVIALNKQVEEG